MASGEDSWITKKIIVSNINKNVMKLTQEIEKFGFTPSPGLRNCFYRKEPNDEWIMLIKIPNDYENTTEYIDERLAGGLFVIASSFMEDMDDTFILLKDWINKSDRRVR